MLAASTCGAHSSAESSFVAEYSLEMRPVWTGRGICTCLSQEESGITSLGTETGSSLKPSSKTAHSPLCALRDD